MTSQGLLFLRGVPRTQQLSVASLVTVMVESRPRLSLRLMLLNTQYHNMSRSIPRLNEIDEKPLQALVIHYLPNT